MSKAILLINATGFIGGAENRYLNLYNFICTSKNDYYLIINRKLFITYDSNQFFSDKSKIIVLDIDGSRKKYNPQDKIKHTAYIQKNRMKRCHFRIFARKTFHKLRLLKVWIIFIIKMRRIIKQYNLKYVYAIWQGGIWGWLLKKMFNIKFAYSYMDASYASLTNNPVDFLEKEYWVLINADIIDCLSSKIAVDLKSKIPFSEKQIISVTPNSFINYSNYYPAENKENQIVFLSRLNPKKNPMLLIESAILLNEFLKEKKYTVLIAGNGSETGSIINAIKKFQLTQISYINEVFGSSQLLSKSKIFISIQKDDNYPSQSLLEAMACENAIIASDVGETQKLVTEKEGILVKLDATAIAEAIKKLIDNEGERKILGHNARQKVLKEHTINNYIKYFYSLEEL